MGSISYTYNDVNDFIKEYNRFLQLSKEACEVYYDYIALETNDDIYLHDIELYEYINDDLNENINQLLEDTALDIEDFNEYYQGVMKKFFNNEIKIELIHDFVGLHGYTVRYLTNKNHFVVFYTG